ncbi:MAG: glycosyltransferase family A protein, partial [Opitutales bacterium]
MDLSSPPSSRWSDPLVGRFWRLAASGWLPARWVQPPLPPPGERAARTGRLHLEIVSHCWQYAHLQRYQLSSLVRFPPRDIEVTMTVYHSRQDEDTVRLLEEFGQRAVPGVSWNWRDLPPPSLFRRAIGRNEAARRTEADWIWFTDCDLLFRENCL